MKNNSANEEYTNEDFGDALNKLKEIRGISYNMISIKSKLSAPYIYDLVAKKKLPPKDENLIKIAKALGVKPEYFYEYRLRRLIDLCRANKEFLDYCLSLAEKFQKKIYSRSAKTGTARTKEAGKARRKEATAG